MWTFPVSRIHNLDSLPSYVLHPNIMPTDPETIAAYIGAICRCPQIQCIPNIWAAMHPWIIHRCQPCVDCPQNACEMQLIIVHVCAW